MNFKRIFPLPASESFVIAVIAIGLLIDFGQRATSGYKDAPTSQVVAIINGNEPLSEVTLIDKEQAIRVRSSRTPTDRLQSGLGRQPERPVDRSAQPAGRRGRPWTPGWARTRPRAS